MAFKKEKLTNDHKFFRLCAKVSFRPNAGLDIGRRGLFYSVLLFKRLQAFKHYRMLRRWEVKKKTTRKKKVFVVAKTDVEITVLKNQVSFLTDMFVRLNRSMQDSAYEIDILSNQVKELQKKPKSLLDCMFSQTKVGKI